jgi:hypothetical protein
MVYKNNTLKKPPILYQSQKFSIALIKVFRLGFEEISKKETPNEI